MDPASFEEYTMPILVIIGIVLTIAGSYNLLMIFAVQFTRRGGFTKVEKIESYLKNKYDLKWTFYLALSSLVGAAISFLTKNTHLLYVNISLFILFGLLFDTYLNTHKSKKLELERYRKIIDKD